MRHGMYDFIVVLSPTFKGMLKTSRIMKGTEQKIATRLRWKQDSNRT